MKMSTKKLIAAVICFILCLVLPLLTGNDRELEKMLSLIHFPVFLCSLICGWHYGLAIGLAVPFLQPLLYRLPAVPENIVPLAVELAVYGLLTGLLYHLQRKRFFSVTVSLISAMIIGRTAGYLMEVLFGEFMTMSSYTKLFKDTIGGIILQIMTIPILVAILNNTLFRATDKEVE